MTVINFTNEVAYLYSLFESIPQHLHSYIESSFLISQQRLLAAVGQAPSVPPTPWNHLLLSANGIPTALVTILFTPLLVLAVVTMSSWWPTSGRYSPFTSFYSSQPPASGPPTITQDDYHYLAPEDESSQPSQSSLSNYFGFGRNNSTAAPSQPEHKKSTSSSSPPPHHHHTHKHHASHSRPSSSRDREHDTAKLGPDVIRLRYRGTVYPLHFDPFSISDGAVAVSDLRRQAAKELGVPDYHRVKLLYKGRQLRDNRAACAGEGLKQNSEVTCVVKNEALQGGASASDDSETTFNGFDAVDDDDAEVIPSGDDNAASKGKKKRKGHRAKKRRPADTNGEAIPTSTSPQPNIRVEHLPTPMPSTQSTSSRQPSPKPPTPLSPASQLDALASTFDTDFLPLLQKYLASPPSSKKERQYEYKKLSEGVLAQVLLKLDGVETGGDESLRRRRKELVKRVNGWLGDLDAVASNKDAR